mmetsp:Transcript_32569/g.95318  ORF Transcript_32569/g.95318 Transcript_32569/m.95318 type:complete len:413 (+) Transcript_32569:777-2015(+)
MGELGVRGDVIGVAHQDRSELPSDASFHIVVVRPMVGGVLGNLVLGCLGGPLVQEALDPVRELFDTGVIEELVCRDGLAVERLDQCPSEAGEVVRSQAEVEEGCLQVEVRLVTAHGARQRLEDPALHIDERQCRGLPPALCLAGGHRPMPRGTLARDDRVGRRSQGREARPAGDRQGRARAELDDVGEWAHRSHRSRPMHVLGAHHRGQLKHGRRCGRLQLVTAPAIDGHPLRRRKAQLQPHRVRRDLRHGVGQEGAVERRVDPQPAELRALQRAEAAGLVLCLELPHCLRGPREHESVGGVLARHVQALKLRDIHVDDGAHDALALQQQHAALYRLDPDAQHPQEHHRRDDRVLEVGATPRRRHGDRRDDALRVAAEAGAQRVVDLPEASQAAVGDGLPRGGQLRQADHGT